MARNRRPQYGGGRPKNKHLPARAVLAPPPPIQAKPPVRYGQPFLLLEDANKNTFIYADGAWNPYDLSIAECRRVQCKVTELSQKVNKMTRYEIRCPIVE